MTVLQLRELANQKIKAARDIQDCATKENRDLNAEEAKNHKDFCDAAERHFDQATRQERLEKLEGIAAMPQPPEVRIEVVDPFKATTTPEGQYCPGKLRAFTWEGGEGAAYRSGMYMRAFLLNDGKARQWCRDHGVEQRVMTESVSTAGGILVPQELSRAIIDLKEKYGVARQLCNPYVMTSDTMIIPRRTTGLTAYAVGEKDSITASDLAFDWVTLVAKKWGTISLISSELNEDATINMADRVANEAAYAFAAKEDNCLFNGDGTAGTYHGITGIRTKIIDGTHTAGWIEATAEHDMFKEIDNTDLASLMAACPSYALPNAKWICSQVAKSLVFDRLANALLGNTTVTVAAGALPSYAGYPIVTTPAMPTSQASLDAKAMILFGDVSQAVAFGDRRGITAKVSTDRYMEYDQIGVMVTERFGIDVHSLGNTTDAGPVVALIGNVA